MLNLCPRPFTSLKNQKYKDKKQIWFRWLFFLYGNLKNLIFLKNFIADKIATLIIIKSDGNFLYPD